MEPTCSRGNSLGVVAKSPSLRGLFGSPGHAFVFTRGEWFIMMPRDKGTSISIISFR